MVPKPSSITRLSHVIDNNDRNEKWAVSKLSYEGNKCVATYKVKDFVLNISKYLKNWSNRFVIWKFEWH